MAEQEKWQWQEPGKAWKGVGLYHITLTIPDRQPLLGTLDIPEGDPTKTIKFCNVHVRQGQDDIIAEATGDKADELTERQLKAPITGLTGYADLEFSKRTSQDGSKVFSNIKFVGFEAM